MSTTTNLPRGATSTKKFKALLALGMDKDQAAKVYQQTVLGIAAEPVEANEPGPIAQLVAAGFTQDEAEHMLAEGQSPEPQPVVAAGLDPIAALIAKHGFDFAKGRVYLGADAIEAAVRVRRTGTPELIASARATTRPRAVVVYQGENGEVIVQNLIREA